MNQYNCVYLEVVMEYNNLFTTHIDLDSHCRMYKRIYGGDIVIYVNSTPTYENK